MRKLFTLLTLLLCVCSGAWAADSTIGRTVVYNASTESATFTGVSNDVTVTASNGSKNTGASGSKDTYYKSSDKVSMNQALCYRDKISGSNLTAYDKDVYVGFQSVVASGKKFTTKKINVQVAVAANFTWRVEIVNASTSEQLYKSSDYAITGFNSASATNEDVTITLDEEDYFDITGTAIVRLHYWNTNNSGSKYFCPLKLTLEGVVADAGAQTKYTKPLIAVGDYNASTGLYPVTLSVQNEEDGKITYTIGDADPVSNVESGTVVNVAPSTQVVAFVSGTSYNPSDNASTNTPAKPKLATPTISVGAYNFNKNTYPVTITTTDGGASLSYTLDGGEALAYSAAIDVAPGVKVQAYAAQTNMTQSDNAEKTIAAAPCGGTATTPTTSGTYTSNVSYVMDAITIPGACIAGQINSGSTPINGSIKGRTNQALSDNTTSGFYVTVNADCKVTGISIRACSNGDAFNCTGVYVDGDLDNNLLSSSVALPKAAKDGETGTIAVSNIEATSRIEFTFSATTQTQMIITVTSEVAGSLVLSDNDNFNYGFGSFCAPHNFTVENGAAYKATLNLNKDAITLTKLEGIVPADKGVIIVGEKGSEATIAYTTEASTADMSYNILHGTTVRKLTSELKGSAAKLLTLQKSTSKFVEYTGEYFPANRAYIITDNDNTALSKAMSFDIKFADATSVKNVEAVTSVNEAKAVKKAIVNGRLVILTENGYVNALGQTVK